MMRKLDTDRDGNLSDAEVANADSPARAAEFRSEMLRHLDKNGDGKISADEEEAAKSNIII